MNSVAELSEKFLSRSHNGVGFLSKKHRTRWLHLKEITFYNGVFNTAYCRTVLVAHSLSRPHSRPFVSIRGSLFASIRGCSLLSSCPL